MSDDQQQPRTPPAGPDADGWRLPPVADRMDAELSRLRAEVTALRDALARSKGPSGTAGAAGQGDGNTEGRADR